MELTTLITGALTILGPYLAKGGEEIAKKVGADMWAWLKSKLSKPEIKEIESSKEEDIIELLRTVLETKSEKDKGFKNELARQIQQAQGLINAQHIENKGNVDKQISIQQNFGDINM